MGGHQLGFVLLVLKTSGSFSPQPGLWPASQKGGASRGAGEDGAWGTELES